MAPSRSPRTSGTGASTTATSGGRSRARTPWSTATPVCSSTRCAWPATRSRRCRARPPWCSPRAAISARLGATVASSAPRSGCRSTRPPPTRSPITATARATPCPAACSWCAPRGPSGRTTRSCVEADPGVLFCSDLISHYGAGDELRFIPFEYHDDPAATRSSVEGLLELPFTVLCLDHGAPLLSDPKASIRRLLAAS